MLLLILSFLGGALTIASPCILPVLPFVFAGAGQPLRRSGLPLLAGMALTFALVATLAAVGGAWVVQANQYGRWLAMALMALFGLTLLLPRLAGRLMRPLVMAGDRLSQRATHGRTGDDGKIGLAADGKAPASAHASFMLGIATGLLWAPCAGPVLGLVLTGAALNGASGGSTLLLLAYAAGAATSLALALLIGGRVLAAMKRSLHAGAWLRKALGAAILAGVATIATGLDTGLLTSVSTLATSALEQQLVDALAPRKEAAAMMAGDAGPAINAINANNAIKATAPPAPGSLPVEGTLAPLSGAVAWLNSAPLTAQQLKGKVVLINFWTYSCINCLRALPYANGWAKKYHDQGLVVIGVHAPEFAFERDQANVRKAVRDLGIDYPVAIDNDFAIWRAMDNQYWPARYIVDAQGRIRHHHFGEGGYVQSEQVIRQLLAEAGSKDIGFGVVSAETSGAAGVQQASDLANVASPETYLGYQRAERFASPQRQAANRAQSYTAPMQPALNQWGLAGDWLSQADQVTLQRQPGRLVYRFHARDLHLVLGPGAEGKPVRFRVSIDGAAPGASHGTDVAPDGTGSIDAQRLYQLVRQAGVRAITDHTFSIEFLDPGVQAYAFTFG